MLSSGGCTLSSGLQNSNAFYPVPEPISPLVDHPVSSTYMTEWNVAFYDAYNKHGKIPENASFIPLLQDYKSGNAYQYDWQIYWATCAGINTFVFDCGIYDTDSEPYLAINRSLSESVYTSKMNFTITYLLSQAFWDKVGTPSINLTERVLDDFDSYFDDFLWRDNLLRKDGIPIMYILLPWDIPSWSNDISDPALVDVINAIRIEFREQLDTDVYLLADLTWPGDSSYLVTACQGIFDGCYKPGGMVFLWADNGWDDMNCQYSEMFYWDNLTSAEFYSTFSASNLSFVPSFSPGFNNSKIPSATWLNEKLIIVERNLSLYETAVRTMHQYIDSPLDILYLQSWNDFQEGTCIEPCVEYGTSYLDAIRNGLTDDDHSDEIFTPESFATHWIDKATLAIESLSETKRLNNVTAAEDLLDQANEAFMTKDYANATILAHAAFEQISYAPDLEDTGSFLLDLVITTSVVGAVILIGGTIIYRRRR